MGTLNSSHDLELLLKSHVPLIVIESTEERRCCDLIGEGYKKLGLPIFCWTAGNGLERFDEKVAIQKPTLEPIAVLQHIKSSPFRAGYILLDFHPYLEVPLHVRLIKEIAFLFEERRSHLIFISHRFPIPEEVNRLSASFKLHLPSKKEIEKTIEEVIEDWKGSNLGKSVQYDEAAAKLLVRNLSGLTLSDVKRLAKKAIFDDGALTHSDITTVLKAKHALLGKEGVLTFEYETSGYSELGGLQKLKSWLEKRKSVLSMENIAWKLDKPKGILLLGVQGCGKSLAARVVAGMWGVPLLRLDFGALYNKFIGETEKNLRDSLNAAAVMAPCVLWFDEIEKAVSTDSNDNGVSQRILGTILTWMSEKKENVFVVATANNIDKLPPELVRKGRFDEIFFVDLPTLVERREIVLIHLKKRDLKPERFDIEKLAKDTEGFSGAEIETVVVSALYTAISEQKMISTEHILKEIAQTRPLSVVMSERVKALRTWALERTVSAS